MIGRNEENVHAKTEQHGKRHEWSMYIGEPWFLEEGFLDLIRNKELCKVVM